MFAGAVYQLCKPPETALPARGEWRGASLPEPAKDEPAHDSELAFTQRETRAVPVEDERRGGRDDPGLAERAAGALGAGARVDAYQVSC